VAPDAIRIAPPLNLTIAEIDLFVDALPGLLDAAKESA
jgi:acetylornithine aminotransferase